MKALVTDREIECLIEEAWSAQGEEIFSPALTVALTELQAHRRDARARGALPIFVAGQSSEGELVDALSAHGEANSDLTRDAYEWSHAILRGAIAELLHLRKHLTLVQMKTTEERELRLRAERERTDAIAERDAMLVALREWSRRKSKIAPVEPKVEAAVVSRTPVEIPDDKQSAAYKAAAARIDAAVDAHRDPDPADLDLVMREQLISAGFDDPEMLDEMVPPPKKTA